MSSVQGIKAGRAYVSLGADDSELQKALRNAERRLNATAKTIQSIGTKMAAIGGTVATGLFAAAVSAGKLGDHLNDLKAKTGIGAEALAGLDLAASSSGSSLDSLAAGINKMQRTFAEASNGSKSANQSLANLGLTLDNLRGLKPEQQFELIADRIAAITDPTKRTAAAVGIFGRSGTELLPVLSLGAKGLRDFQKQADDLGVTLAYKTARGVGEFDDALAATKKQLDAVKVTIGAAIASALLPYRDSIAQTLKRTIEWAASNKNQIQDIGRLAVKVTAAGVALIGMAGALTVLAKSAKAASVALTLITKHPLLLAATAIASIVASLVLYEKLVASQNNKLQISLNEYTQANDEARASEVERIESLRALAETGKLNDAQMGQAQTIITQLESTYGDLGITIDKTTGQINGMADAWDKVTRAMANAAKADIEKQIASIDTELSRLDTEARKLGGAWSAINRITVSDLPQIKIGSQQGPQQKQGVPKIIQDNIDATNAALAEKQKLNKRMRDIDAGLNQTKWVSTDALTGGAKPIESPAQPFAPIVDGFEDVGDAADIAREKTSRWLVVMDAAKKMMDDRRGATDLLSQLEIDNARATGNDKMADQLEVLREYAEVMESIRSNRAGFRGDELQQATATARANAESQLRALEQIGRRAIGFSAGVVNSNAIGSLNRASKGTAPGVSELKKNVEQNVKIISLLQKIADSGGLVFQ